MKKLVSTLLIIFQLSVFSFAATKTKTNKKNPSTEKELPPAALTEAKPVAVEGPVSHPDLEMDDIPVTTLSAIELVKEMKAGWNLGNSLDAIGGSGLNTETSWGQPRTTIPIIEGIKAAGFRTIRIPISWNKHVSTDGKYTIDAEWMKRVKLIVGWAYDLNMFIIINSHHDCYEHNAPISSDKGFYYPSKQNKTASCDYLRAIWTQIAEAFADYDNHLIFETMNEPRLRGTGNEWYYDPNSDLCKEARDALYEMNKVALEAIRSVKGNEKRLVMMPALQASPDSAFAAGFELPPDESNMIALSVHMYAPYTFAMASPGESKFTSTHKANLDRYFSKLNSQFVSKGIPVVIGEYGATNKNNLADREDWFSYFIKGSRKYGIPCILWDNGNWRITSETAPNRFEEHFGYYNRNRQTWFFPTLIDKIMEACDE